MVKRNLLAEFDKENMMTPYKRSRFTPSRSLARQVRMNTRALRYERNDETTTGTNYHFTITDNLVDMDANLSYLKLNINPGDCTSLRVLVYCPKDATAQVSNQGMSALPDPQSYTVLYDSAKVVTNGAANSKMQNWSKLIKLYNKYYEAHTGNAIRNPIKVYVYTVSGPAYVSSLLAYRVKD